MAKRRHEAEHEDEEVFRMPDFDKEEYVKEEINRAKASMVPVILGIVFGIISALVFISLSSSLSWPVGAAFGILGIFLIKPMFPMFRVDVSMLKKKDFLGHGAIYLFTWLVLFILLLNPPFADFTAPSVGNVHLEGLDNSTGNWTVVSSGSNMSSFSEFRVVALVSDNVAVRSVEISIDGSDWKEMQMVQDGAYICPISYSQPFAYSIKASDINGHEVLVNGTLP